MHALQRRRAGVHIKTYTRYLVEPRPPAGNGGSDGDGEGADAGAGEAALGLGAGAGGASGADAAVLLPWVLLTSANLSKAAWGGCWPNSLRGTWKLDGWSAAVRSARPMRCSARPTP